MGRRFGLRRTDRLPHSETSVVTPPENWSPEDSTRHLHILCNDFDFYSRVITDEETRTMMLRAVLVEMKTEWVRLYGVTT